MKRNKPKYTIYLPSNFVRLVYGKQNEDYCIYDSSCLITKQGVMVIRVMP